MEEARQKLIDFIIENEFITKPSLKTKFVRLVDELIDTVES